MPITAVDYDPFATHGPVSAPSAAVPPASGNTPNMPPAPAATTPQQVPSALAPGTVNGGYQFKGGDPSLPESWEPLHGEAFLKTLSPAQQSLVQGIVRGDIANPTGFAMAKPYWQQAIAQAQQYDPTFSQTLWPTRVAMRQEVAKGKFGQNLNALNAAIQHSGNLLNSAHGIWGYQIPLVGQAVNTIGNTIEDWSGDPRITKYQQDALDLSHELRRVYAQTGTGSQADLDAFEKAISQNLSLAQKRAAVQEQVKLMAGKANAIYDQYVQSMGPDAPPLKVLSPGAVSTLKSLGMNPLEMGFHPSAYINERAIQMLKKNPKLAPQFDQQFGKGAASQILER